MICFCKRMSVERCWVIIGRFSRKVCDGRCATDAGRSTGTDRATRFTVHAGRCHRAVAMAALPPRDGTQWPVAWPDQPRLLRSPAGRKDVFLGERRYHYDHQTTLFTTAEMPVVSQITTASAEQPFFGVVVMIDPAEVGPSPLMPRYRRRSLHRPPRPWPSIPSIRLSWTQRCDSCARSIPHPKPGSLLHLSGGRSSFGCCRDHSATRCWPWPRAAGRPNDEWAGRSSGCVTILINRCGSMLWPETWVISVSSFHHHFKAVTAMSPLQFQKHLRLQEARRLLRSGDVDATAAAFRVGYDDTSHFSREYRRQFGEPPLRDVRRLRNEPVPTDRAAF